MNVANVNRCFLILCISNRSNGIVLPLALPSKITVNIEPAGYQVSWTTIFANKAEWSSDRLSIFTARRRAMLR